METEKLTSDENISGRSSLRLRASREEPLGRVSGSAGRGSGDAASKNSVFALSPEQLEQLNSFSEEVQVEGGKTPKGSRKKKGAGAEEAAADGEDKNKQQTKSANAEGFGENLDLGKRKPVRINPFMPTLAEETAEEVAEQLGDDTPWPSSSDCGKGRTAIGDIWKQRLAVMAPGDWDVAYGLGWSFQNLVSGGFMGATDITQSGFAKEKMKREAQTEEEAYLDYLWGGIDADFEDLLKVFQSRPQPGQEEDKSSPKGVQPDKSTGLGVGGVGAGVSVIGGVGVAGLGGASMHGGGVSVYNPESPSGGMGGLDESQIAMFMASQQPSPKQQATRTFLERLVRHLQSPKHRDRLIVAKYLSVIIRDTESAYLFAHFKGVDPLMRFVKTSDYLHEYMPNILSCLCLDDSNRKLLISKGALGTLFRMAKKSAAEITPAVTVPGKDSKTRESRSMGGASQALTNEGPVLSTAIAALVNDGSPITPCTNKEGVLISISIAIACLVIYDDVVPKLNENIDVILSLVSVAPSMGPKGTLCLRFLAAGLCILTAQEANQGMLVYKNGLTIVAHTLLHTRDPVAKVWLSATLANLAANPINSKSMMEPRILEVIHSLCNKTITVPGQLRPAGETPNGNSDEKETDSEATKRVSAVVSESIAVADEDEKPEASEKIKPPNTLTLENPPAARRNAAWTLLNLSMQKSCFPRIEFVRDMMLLAATGTDDPEILNVVQLAFAHFIGIEKKHLMSTATPAITAYMERFGNKRQDLIKDQALRYVYQVIEEEEGSDMVMALLRAACDGEDNVQRDSLWLLNVLFLDRKYQQLVMDNGGLEPLILYAELPRVDVQRVCAQTMIKVALEGKMYQVREYNPITALLLLSNSADQDVRKSALVSLWITSTQANDWSSPLHEEMTDQIVEACVNHVAAADLEEHLREVMQPKVQEFQRKHNVNVHREWMKQKQAEMEAQRKIQEEQQARANAKKEAQGVPKNLTFRGDALVEERFVDEAAGKKKSKKKKKKEHKVKKKKSDKDDKRESMGATKTHESKETKGNSSSEEEPASPSHLTTSVLAHVEEVSFMSDDERDAAKHGRSDSPQHADVEPEFPNHREFPPGLGVECLAALSKEASPGVQGKVVFRLQYLVKNVDRLSLLSKKCLIYSLLALQQTELPHTQKSLSEIWRELYQVFDSKGKHLDPQFAVQCARALVYTVTTSDLLNEMKDSPKNDGSKTLNRGASFAAKKLDYDQEDDTIENAGVDSDQSYEADKRFTAGPGGNGEGPGKIDIHSSYSQLAIQSVYLLAKLVNIDLVCKYLGSPYLVTQLMYFCNKVRKLQRTQHKKGRKMQKDKNEDSSDKSGSVSSEILSSEIASSSDEFSSDDSEADTAEGSELQEKLWIILLKVCSSVLCVNTYSLLAEHKQVILSLFNSLKVEQFDSLAIPVAGMLRRCACWPILLDDLLLQAPLYNDLLEYGNLTGNIEILLEMTQTLHQLSEYLGTFPSSGYDEFCVHMPDLLDNLFTALRNCCEILRELDKRIVKDESANPHTGSMIIDSMGTGLSGNSMGLGIWNQPRNPPAALSFDTQDSGDEPASIFADGIGFLGDPDSNLSLHAHHRMQRSLRRSLLKVLSLLAKDEAVQKLIYQADKLNAELFSRLFYDTQAVPLEFYEFLNSCSSMQDLRGRLASVEFIQRLIQCNNKLLSSKSSDPRITEIARLLYTLTTVPEVLPLLKEQDCADTIFNTIIYGSAEAQEVAIRVVHVLAIDPKIKRMTIRRGMFEELCHLACASSLQAGCSGKNAHTIIESMAAAMKASLMFGSKSDEEQLRQESMPPYEVVPLLPCAEKQGNVLERLYGQDEVQVLMPGQSQFIVRSTVSGLSNGPEQSTAPNRVGLEAGLEEEGSNRGKWEDQNLWPVLQVAFSAAWLVTSFFVRGEGRDLMLDSSRMHFFMDRLLNKMNHPRVLIMTVWVLSQIPPDEGIAKLLSFSGEDCLLRLLERDIHVKRQAWIEHVLDKQWQLLAEAEEICTGTLPLNPKACQDIQHKEDVRVYRHLDIADNKGGYGSNVSSTLLDPLRNLLDSEDQAVADCLADSFGVLRGQNLFSGNVDSGLKGFHRQALLDEQKQAAASGVPAMMGGAVGGLNQEVPRGGAFMGAYLDANNFAQTEPPNLREDLEAKYGDHEQWLWQRIFWKQQLEMMNSDDDQHAALCRSVVAQAAKTIGVLSRNSSFRKRVIEKGVIPLLLDLLDYVFMNYREDGVDDNISSIPLGILSSINEQPKLTERIDDKGKGPAISKDLSSAAKISFQQLNMGICIAIGNILVAGVSDFNFYTTPRLTKDAKVFHNDALNLRTYRVESPIRGFANRGGDDSDSSDDNGAPGVGFGGSLAGSPTSNIGENPTSNNGGKRQKSNGKLDVEQMRTRLMPALVDLLAKANPRPVRSASLFAIVPLLQDGSYLKQFVALDGVAKMLSLDLVLNEEDTLGEVSQSNFGIDHSMAPGAVVDHAIMGLVAGSGGGGNKPNDFVDEEQDYFGLELVDLGDIGSDTEANDLAPSTELCLIRAIRHLAADDSSRHALRSGSNHAFEVIVALSRSSNPQIQEEVAWAIGVLASDANTEPLLAEMGAIQVLFDYATKGTTEAIIQRATWSIRLLSDECIQYHKLLHGGGEASPNEKAGPARGPGSNHTSRSKTGGKLDGIIEGQDDNDAFRLAAALKPAYGGNDGMSPREPVSEKKKELIKSPLQQTMITPGKGKGPLATNKSPRGVTGTTDKNKVGKVVISAAGEATGKAAGSGTAPGGSAGKASSAQGGNKGAAGTAKAAGTRPKKAVQNANATSNTAGEAEKGKEKKGKERPRNVINDVKDMLAALGGSMGQNPDNA